MSDKNALKRFGGSLEWFMERVGFREEEIELVKTNGERDECEKDNILRAKMMKNRSCS